MSTSIQFSRSIVAFIGINQSLSINLMSLSLDLILNEWKIFKSLMIFLVE